MTLMMTGVFAFSSSASATVYGDDYPAQWRNVAQDSVVDTWGEYNRECTSFVAWRLHSKNGFEMPFNADAGLWKSKAQALGYVVDSNPAVGSVAWDSGHVAWVAAVPSSTTVTIEDYNHYISGSSGPVDGAYHTSTVAKSTYQYIHFKDTTGSSTSPTSWTGVGSATNLGTNLVAGQQIHANQYITSPDGRYVLLMQPDGNLVIYTSYGSVWSLGYSGNSGAFLSVQSDGNIVLYSSTQTALWNTGQRGTTNIRMQNDGNLVAYNANGVATWQSSSSTYDSGTTAFGSYQLVTGQQLHQGQYLQSSDGRYRLVLQSDGNLVLYAPGYRVLWKSNTSGTINPYLIVQGDGNVVLYPGTGPAVWSTGTGGVNTLRVQDDGNLVGLGGSTVWNTGTSGLT